MLLLSLTRYDGAIASPQDPFSALRPDLKRRQQGSPANDPWRGLSNGAASRRAKIVTPRTPLKLSPQSTKVSAPFKLEVVRYKSCWVGTPNDCHPAIVVLLKNTSGKDLASIPLLIQARFVEQGTGYIYNASETISKKRFSPNSISTVLLVAKEDREIGVKKWPSVDCVVEASPLGFKKQVLVLAKVDSYCLTEAKELLASLSKNVDSLHKGGQNMVVPQSVSGDYRNAATGSPVSSSIEPFKKKIVDESSLLKSRSTDTERRTSSMTETNPIRLDTGLRPKTLGWFGKGIANIEELDVGIGSQEPVKTKTSTDPEGILWETYWFKAQEHLKKGEIAKAVILLEDATEESHTGKKRWLVTTKLLSELYILQGRLDLYKSSLRLLGRTIDYKSFISDAEFFGSAGDLTSAQILLNTALSAYVESCPSMSENERLATLRQLSALSVKLGDKEVRASCEQMLSVFDFDLPYIDDSTMGYDSKLTEQVQALKTADRDFLNNNCTAAARQYEILCQAHEAAPSASAACDLYYRSLNRLCLVLCVLGRANEAESMIRKAIAEREQKATVVERAVLMESLAIVYTAQNKFTAGDALYERVIEIFSRSLGENHPKVILSLWDFAKHQAKQGNDDSALALFCKAYRQATEQGKFGGRERQLLAVDYARILRKKSQNDVAVSIENREGLNEIEWKEGIASTAVACSPSLSDSGRASRQFVSMPMPIRISPSAYRKWIGIAHPKFLAGERDGTIVSIAGAFQDVFNLFEIPYTKEVPKSLEHMDVGVQRIFALDGDSPLSATEKISLRRLVALGSSLIVTDEGLSKIIVECFPGLITFSEGYYCSRLVDAEVIDQSDQLTANVPSRTSWQLAPRSPPIRVIKPTKVKVLAKSETLTREDPYGTGVLACTFGYGRGTVLLVLGNSKVAQLRGGDKLNDPIPQIGVASRHMMVANFLMDFLARSKTHRLESIDGK